MSDNSDKQSLVNLLLKVFKESDICYKYYQQLYANIVIHRCYRKTKEKLNIKSFFKLPFLPFTVALWGLPLSLTIHFTGKGFSPVYGY